MDELDDVGIAFSLVRECPGAIRGIFVIYLCFRSAFFYSMGMTHLRSFGAPVGGRRKYTVLPNLKFTITLGMTGI